MDWNSQRRSDSARRPQIPQSHMDWNSQRRFDSARRPQIPQSHMDWNSQRRSEWATPCRLLSTSGYALLEVPARNNNDENVKSNNTRTWYIGVDVAGFNVALNNLQVISETNLVYHQLLQVNCSGSNNRKYHENFHIWNANWKWVLCNDSNQICHFFLSHMQNDNPSTSSWIMCRARPTAWKSRTALSEGPFLALWSGSIGIQSAGGIFGFPQLRYSQGGRHGCRLPSSPNLSLKTCKSWHQHWLLFTTSRNT